MYREMERVCKGGRRNYGSNSQCGCKILGQRGNIEMCKVFMLSCLFLEWGPNTYFYRPKDIVTVEVVGYG
jgi:hypothetical protein